MSHVLSPTGTARASCRTEATTGTRGKNERVGLVLVEFDERDGAGRQRVSMQKVFVHLARIWRARGEDGIDAVRQVRIPKEAVQYHLRTGTTVCESREPWEQARGIDAQYGHSGTKGHNGLRESGGAAIPTMTDH